MNEKKLKIIIIGESIKNSKSLAEAIFKVLPGTKINIATKKMQCIKTCKRP